MTTSIDIAAVPARERPDWDRRLAAKPAALQQSWAYGAALERLGATALRRRLRVDGRTVGLVQLVARRITIGGRRLASMALASRGPVWLEELDAPTRGALCRALRRAVRGSGLWLSVLTPERGDAEACAVAGLRRVWTGASCATLRLDGPAETWRARMRSKWRNRLVAAEASGLRVEESRRPLERASWLFEREAEQRRVKGYRAPPPEFAALFQAAAGGGSASLWTARSMRRGSPVAAMLFLRHGAAATYQIGWSSDEGRRRGAHNLLLWRAMNALAEQGAARLDLGGVDTVSAPGLARFKLGAGAEAVSLPGSYI